MLFKKVRFLIFLNNQVTVSWIIIYCLKRKNSKIIFSF
jgi:hypothetical protein